jgi:carbamoyl-phosphate synthase large subunit
VLTHAWLVKHGLPVPRQSTPEIVLDKLSEWDLPVIVKPSDGSASVGVRVVTSHEELITIAAAPANLIVQELIEGTEYTVNVFVNKQGKCLCAVPHRRLETRGGEVSKGQTVKDERLMEVASLLVEGLPGAFGALNVQCFLTASGDIKIIETNARFGGGFPLAHRAGAPFTRWLIEQLLGREPENIYTDWEDGLTMLRYDEAIFVTQTGLCPKQYATAIHRI